MDSERNNYLTQKYAKRWYWCTTCHCASVAYTCCGNSTCNCGGCPNCDETYDEVCEMRKAGLIPKITEIAGAVDAQRRADLSLIKNHLNAGATPEDIDDWLRKMEGRYFSFASWAEVPQAELAAAPDAGELLLG